SHGGRWRPHRFREAPSAAELAQKDSVLGASLRRGAASAAFLRSRADSRALAGRAACRAALRRARESRHPLPATRVALGGMVLARRYPWHRGPVLSRASAARAARAAHHARSG